MSSGNSINYKLAAILLLLIGSAAGLIVALLMLDSSEFITWPLIAILGVTLLAAVLAILSILFKQFGIVISKDGLKFICSILVAFALLGSAAGLIVAINDLNSSDSMNWPLIGILGITLLAAVLATMSVVFNQIGIGDKKYAFGLPQGSIRAFIALSLVVIFIIFVIFLYYDLADTSSETRVIKGLSEDQYKSIQVEDIINVTERPLDTDGTEFKYDVTLAPIEQSQESKDLAKQVVTIVGTLMAAVSSFYFGARFTTTKEGALGIASSTYPVTYDANEADKVNVPPSQEKPHGKDLILAKNSGNLKKKGYTFTGWNTIKDGSGKHYDEGAIYNENAPLTLYAEWGHTVTFDSNGGSGKMEPQSAHAPEDLNPNKFTPPQQGQTFDEWKDATGKSYTDRATYSFNEDITLKAQWK